VKQLIEPSVPIDAMQWGAQQRNEETETEKARRTADPRADDGVGMCERLCHSVIIASVVSPSFYYGCRLLNGLSNHAHNYLARRQRR
jgi:hypothetical protein